LKAGKGETGWAPGTKKKKKKLRNETVKDGNNGGEKTKFPKPRKRNGLQK